MHLHLCRCLIDAFSFRSKTLNSPYQLSVLLYNYVGAIYLNETLNDSYNDQLKLKWIVSASLLNSNSNGSDAGDTDCGDYDGGNKYNSFTREQLSAIDTSMLDELLALIAPL